MKPHLIKLKSIEQYVADHQNSKTYFESWWTAFRRTDWNTPTDIKRDFPAADLLGNGSNRAIFDIGHNRYRMICRYRFGENTVHLFVCWIGTHAAYTKLCAATQQYTVSVY